MRLCDTSYCCAGLPFLFGAALMLVTFALAMTIDRKAADHGRYKEHAEAKAESATEPLLPQGAHDQGGQCLTFKSPRVNGCRVLSRIQRPRLRLQAMLLPQGAHSQAWTLGPRNQCFQGCDLAGRG